MADMGPDRLAALLLSSHKYTAKQKRAAFRAYALRCKFESDGDGDNTEETGKKKAPTMAARAVETAIRLHLGRLQGVKRPTDRKKALEVEQLSVAFGTMLLKALCKALPSEFLALLAPEKLRALAPEKLQQREAGRMLTLLHSVFKTVRDAYPLNELLIRLEVLRPVLGALVNENNRQEMPSVSTQTALLLLLDDFRVLVPARREFRTALDEEE